MSLTDKHYYQIKNINAESKQLDKKYEIFVILKRIKLKLLGFFIFTFIFFCFYWYLIAVFCAVYQSTQIIFIKDFITSFIMGLIFPFILYLFPSVLRIMSLRVSNNKN